MAIFINLKEDYSPSLSREDYSPSPSRGGLGWGWEFEYGIKFQSLLNPTPILSFPLKGKGRIIQRLSILRELFTLPV